MSGQQSQAYNNTSMLSPNSNSNNPFLVNNLQPKGAIGLDNNQPNSFQQGPYQSWLN